MPARSKKSPTESKRNAQPAIKGTLSSPQKGPIFGLEKVPVSGTFSQQSLINLGLGTSLGYQNECKNECKFAPKLGPKMRKMGNPDLKDIAAKPRRRRRLLHMCNPKKIGTASKATAVEYQRVAKLRKIMDSASQPAKHRPSARRSSAPMAMHILDSHETRINHAKNNTITCTIVSATMMFQFGRSEKWSDLVPEKWPQKGHRTRA